MKIQLKIKTLENFSFQIEIDDANIISELKDKIQIKIGMSKSTQCLIYQGKVLKDDQQIFSYSISQNSTIYLLRQQTRRHERDSQRDALIQQAQQQAIPISLSNALMGMLPRTTSTTSTTSTPRTTNTIRIERVIRPQQQQQTQNNQIQSNSLTNNDQNISNQRTTLQQQLQQTISISLSQIENRFKKQLPALTRLLNESSESIHQQAHSQDNTHFSNREFSTMFREIGQSLKWLSIQLRSLNYNTSTNKLWIDPERFNSLASRSTNRTENRENSVNLPEELGANSGNNQTNILDEVQRQIISQHRVSNQLREDLRMRSNRNESLNNPEEEMTQSVEITTTVPIGEELNSVLRNVIESTSQVVNNLSNTRNSQRQEETSDSQNEDFLRLLFNLFQNSENQNLNQNQNQNLNQNLNQNQNQNQNQNLDQDQDQEDNHSEQNTESPLHSQSVSLSEPEDSFQSDISTDNDDSKSDSFQNSQNDEQDIDYSYKYRSKEPDIQIPENLRNLGVDENTDLDISLSEFLLKKKIDPKNTQSFEKIDFLVFLAQNISLHDLIMINLQKCSSVNFSVVDLISYIRNIVIFSDNSSSKIEFVSEKVIHFIIQKISNLESLSKIKKKIKPGFDFIEYFLLIFKDSFEKILHFLTSEENSQNNSPENSDVLKEIQKIIMKNLRAFFAISTNMFPEYSDSFQLLKKYIKQFQQSISLEFDIIADSFLLPQINDIESKNKRLFKKADYPALSFVPQSEKKIWKQTIFHDEIKQKFSHPQILFSNSYLQGFSRKNKVALQSIYHRIQDLFNPNPNPKLLASLLESSLKKAQVNSLKISEILNNLNSNVILNKLFIQKFFFPSILSKIRISNDLLNEVNKSRFPNCQKLTNKKD
ncbi:ubiquitin domain-containing protein 7sl RNA1-related [Anaeramoeba ignava]|uniref:Ubiquitin domain-containing protein 7sl RNA1-related n=1 Tax=Anaeramoeba ignava TaxID=1746090 RepID=A0A9Q0LQW0_ANAIG|nr:ubiquitin domain-containing protein 7sl RNA1-related [Anaeramoeba ignava]